MHQDLPIKHPKAVDSEQDEIQEMREQEQELIIPLPDNIWDIIREETGIIRTSVGTTDGIPAGAEEEPDFVFESEEQAMDGFEEVMDLLLKDCIEVNLFEKENKR
ncbi:hypothetical protein ALC56_11941 [Trachymyrmex septentrionalis]|uniref:Uncharacterized protein n=2 Tax=Trachymyrmex septentrionalis TaxID=34720 RepID=A0A195F0P8_9HYME|nr:PREDICTED: uncharacterized protein LOC108753381 isoform X2 [Trachymyrmex septentrionalis]KYN33684.1 hypothetical protein ALC56_11941 [Trachymyrmex septentrionalis]